MPRRASQPKSKSSAPPSRRTASKRTARGQSADSATQRLQRVLASAGYGSRRKCEELIEAGRVDVDGEVVTKLGTTVDPSLQKISVDGVRLKKRKLVYFAVNKPTGVVTTNRDPQGRPRVVDLVPPAERVFPVGRLDRSSEGLILLTNDGELAQKLTHPKFGVRKIYRVMVAGKVVPETMKTMRKGVYIAEGFVKVEGAKLIKAGGKSTELEITLKEGKNREIRRILARLGHKVQQLRRIAVGPLRLGDVPPGAYRVLLREEVDKLWAAVDAAEVAAANQPAASKRRAKQGAGRKRGESSGRSKSSKGTTPGRGGARKSTNRRSQADGQAVTELPLTGSRVVGAVIGGDAPQPASGDRKPAKSKRKVARKRQATGGRPRGDGKSAAGKNSGKRKRGS